MAPSAKMQTTWPASSSRRALTSDSHNVTARAGPHRNRFRQAEEPVERFHLVIRAVHHEADETLHARADQKAVHMRDVIRHQQRRAAERNIFRAHDADAEHRVGEHPQHEAHQKIRNQAHAVDRRQQREDSEGQDDLVG